MAAKTPAATPVALITQRRISDDGATAFPLWLARVDARLQTWPGFVAQEVVPPTPPTSVDWTIVQHFSDADAARAWLQSAGRMELLDQIRSCFVGQEEVHILPETGPRPSRSSSALLTYRVPPADEPEFLKWQGRIQAAQAKFPGFMRHKIERPIPGVHDDWLIVINFDTEANLMAWIDSPERQALIAEGGRFGKDVKVRHTSYGFDFWFPGNEAASGGNQAIFKNNLLILLVLYPVVFLWSYFISAPFIDSRGVPFWLSLFIGNVFSTQLLGWVVAPAAFRLFDWWLKPAVGMKRQIAGYGAMALLYALSMALYAFLLGHPL